MKRQLHNLPRLLLPLLCGLAACAETCTGEADGQGEGRMAIECSVAADCADRGSAVRAEGRFELPADLIPAPEAFRVTIADLQEENETDYPTLGECDEFTLLAGRYRIDLAYGDPADETSDRPAFGGSREIEVVARKSATERVTVAMTNSAVRIAASEWFRNYYPSFTLLLRTESGVRIDFDDTSTDLERLRFVAPGQSLYLSGSAVKTNGVEVSFPETRIGATAGRTLHTLSVDASQAGEGTLTVRLDDTLNEITPEIIELNPEI